MIKIPEQKEELIVELTPEGLGPWSYSKLDVLVKCPLQFYLKYILKAKVPDAPIVAVTEVGKAAHRILELGANGKSLTDAFSTAKREYGDRISEEDWASQVLSLEFNIGEFLDKLSNIDREHGIKRCFSEIKIGVTQGWDSTGFFAKDVFFRGVIDLVLQLRNNDVLYFDFKTGAPAIMGVKNFKTQLDIYKVLFHYGIEKTSGGQSTIFFIKDGETKSDDYVEADHIESKLTNRITCGISDAVDRVKELGYFKHIAGNKCKYCEYREPCKNKELSKLEAESSKWFKLKEIK